MPKVTEEHRERRRQQILDAARECFLRKGFHQTSMSDVFAESGLSAGAVYGYFKGKDEIISAIAEQVLVNVELLLDPLIDEDPPPTLESVLRHMFTTLENIGFGQQAPAELAAQVWAEVPRNEALAALVQEKYRWVRHRLQHAIERQQAVGGLTPDVPAEKIAMVVFGSMLGYLVQGVVIGDVNPDLYADGFAALLAHPR